MKKRPSRVISHHLEEETADGIEEDQEPEDLTVKAFFSLPPFQKEKKS
jgi:hypothetical protein